MLDVHLGRLLGVRGVTDMHVVIQEIPKYLAFICIPLKVEHLLSQQDVIDSKDHVIAITSYEIERNERSAIIYYSKSFGLIHLQS